MCVCADQRGSRVDERGQRGQKCDGQPNYRDACRQVSGISFFPVSLPLFIPPSIVIPLYSSFYAFFQTRLLFAYHPRFFFFFLTNLDRFQRSFDEIANNGALYSGRKFNGFHSIRFVSIVPCVDHVKTRKVATRWEVQLHENRTREIAVIDIPSRYHCAYRVVFFFFSTYLRQSRGFLQYLNAVFSLFQGAEHECLYHQAQQR